ncbi:hypothetical protein Pelo_6153 [Pelomyxa schiedti]|nr:hypothetical protein Pelo_6153 [Pelomyxa schiedti]
MECSGCRHQCVKACGHNCKRCREFTAQLADNKDPDDGDADVALSGSGDEARPEEEMESSSTSSHTEPSSTSHAASSGTSQTGSGKKASTFHSPTSSKGSGDKMSESSSSLSKKGSDSGEKEGDEGEEKEEGKPSASGSEEGEVETLGPPITDTLGSVTLSKCGPALLVSVTVTKKQGGIINCGECQWGKSGPVFVQVAWARDNVNMYRIWLKIKDPDARGKGKVLYTKVKSNIKTKFGHVVRTQHTQLWCNPFVWRGIFHMTHLVGFPPVITFRVEEDKP